jgi:hypothetical protein
VEVGKALTLLHHRHAHPWTVAELARRGCRGPCLGTLPALSRGAAHSVSDAMATRVGSPRAHRHESQRGADCV